MPNTRTGQTYNSLNILLKSVVDTGLAANGVTDVTVTQNYQPTQEGIVDGNVVYFFNIAPNVRRGWVGKTDTYQPDPAKANFAHAENQWYESLFQCTCIMPQNPADMTQMTSADLANLVASILQSDSALQTFKAAGVGILRIADVKNPPFFNDKDLFNFAATVDFTLTHENTIVSEVPKVDEYDFELKRV